MQVSLIDFKVQDGMILNGFITSNNNNNNKILIATHGMSSNCFKEREKVIASKCVENGIDFLGYNNRGSELVKYTKKIIDEKEEQNLGGTTYEDVIEGYFDIKGAILKAVELGYEEIYLQGHSLGATKTVYTYNKLKEENSELLKYIKGIILLSLIDIPRAIKVYSKEKFEEYFKFAEDKEKEKSLYELMPYKAFIHPISVKTYLRYTKYCKEIDFAKYSENNDFEVLNNISTPLFMRWGNVNEMILQNAEDLVNMLNEIIKNPNKDINYIDGADHSYKDRREELAKQIISFIIKNIA